MTVSLWSTEDTTRAGAGADGDPRAEIWTCNDEEMARLTHRLPWRRALGAEERHRVERLATPSARRRTIGSLLLRRVVLSLRTGCRPAQLRFVTGRFGRPELAHNPWRLRFNVSHAAGLLVCVVVRDRDCGIDVEAPPASAEVIRFGARTFAAAEQAILDALPAGRRAAEFTERWLLKEAYTKALGLGMQRRFNSFELGRDGVDRIVLRDPAAEGAWNFLVTTPPGAPGHRIAVALRRAAGDPDPLPVSFHSVSQAYAFLGVPDLWASYSSTRNRNNRQIGVGI